MKKLFTLLAAIFLLATTAKAQSAEYDQFPIKVTSGLTTNSILKQYYWDSPYYTFEKPVEGVRITFLKNNTGNEYNGFPMIAIAELTVYDRQYNVLKYPDAKITTNSLEASEGALANIGDGIWDTYYHSAWKYAAITPDDYVYIDIKFDTPLSTFALTMVSRNQKLAPESIVITPTGVQYDGTTDDGNTNGGGGEEDKTPDIKLQPVDVYNDSICFVYLSNGGIDAYQRSYMSGDSYQNNGNLYIPLSDGTTVEYSAASFDSCSSVVPTLPTLSTYKFNNKYNANLNIDAIADTISDTIRFALNAIGKSLTASFNLSDERAIAYIDTTLQISKETRTRFDAPINYIVTYPGYNIVQKIKVKDEVWDNGEETIEEIPLRAEMLYTNKPSQVGDELANMLDNNPATVFHSVYGASYDASVLPYITIELDEPVQQLKFYYMTRTFGNYNPTGLALYASTDNENWTPIAQYSTADGLPIDPAGAEFTSPTIDLGAKYKHIKLEQTSSEYHNNHMVFAEFRLYEVTPGSGEPTKVEDAEYRTIKVPFGRIYTIDIEWLTDQQNAVPRIDINVEGGYTVTSKEYYRKAKFSITGYGVYEDFEDSVQIKGRGNSTWGYPKKPYRLKFDKKKKPFGLTNGKSWVLLANYQRGSLMANAIAMKVGQLAEAPYTNHIIPVEVYMNGVYLGSYMFTEKVGFANNSVDIDEDLGTGYMLELDSYYDETYKFKSDSYELPVNIKEPDLTEIEDKEIAQQKFFNIQGDFNRFETSLYNNQEIGNVLDLDAAARFMLANDLVMNQEIGHPKSTYLWREDYTNADSKITFGPLWDFDWAFGYEGTSSYCSVSATSSVLSYNMYNKPGYNFFQDLMNNEEFKRHYLKVWKEFVQKGYINEVIEFMDDYYNFAKSSFEHNYTVWGDGLGYDTSIDRMQQWMKERHDHISANLDNVEITDILYTLLGDVDCNNQLTVHDIALIVNYLAGKSNAAFNAVKADIDDNGKIDVNDAFFTASQVAAADAVSSLYYFNTPIANALLSAEDIEAPIGENTELPLNLVALGNSGYKAIQMDIELPTGVALVEATADESLAASFLCNQTGEQSYRIVAYTPDNDTFYEDEAITNLLLNVSEVIPEEQRLVKITNILTIDEENIEQRIANLEAHFSLTTGISTEAATIGISGGKQLTISLLKSQKIDIYSVDGRKVRTVNATEGTTRVELPAGIYVVQGKKVIIR